MNKTQKETEALLSELLKEVPRQGPQVIVAPSFVNLAAAKSILGESGIQVAAQNMHQAQSGAYTGEVSAQMLLDIGVDTVILGHSERRSLFGETDELLAQKVKAALEADMKIIFCFGEELEDRKSGRHFEVVGSQLNNALFELGANSWKNIILAYEPVWAIGTGETASPEQAQEMHAFVRASIAKVFGPSVSEGVSVLYGGSVKPSNAAEIFSKPDVDGGLIGGASLVVPDFVSIINSI